MSAYSAGYGALLWRMGDTEAAYPILATAVAALPGAERDGARARIALATIHAARNELSLARTLLDEAVDGLPRAELEDPRLSADVERLRARFK